MDVLIFKSETADVVSMSEICVGDIFIYGYNSTTREPIQRRVTDVIEQRKEKGVHKEEANRRMWARVKHKIVEQP